MAKYGFPYMGSKNAIADEIIAIPPAGKRLIDLFGGGGAITHCAALSGKWETVVYNEYNPLCYRLFCDAVEGKYSYDRFTPEWISREDFYRLKKTDGYVKYVWSFGNNGEDYLFGRGVEANKKAVHQLVVFGEPLPTEHPFFGCELKETGITARRLELKRWAKAEKSARSDVERLQQLERIERFQQLERIERFQQLVATNDSYESYEYQEGDVVYCDPPYNTETQKIGARYTNTFDYDRFYEWVQTRNFPLYISEYSLPFGREIWSRDKRCLTGIYNSAGRQQRVERLYLVGKDAATWSLIASGM